MQENVLQAVERIRRMESIFDALKAVFAQDQAAFFASGEMQRQLQLLIDYYENGRWLRDFQMDEAGLLPPNLKRGVLSEDGVYNFLSDIDVARADVEADV